MKWVEEFKEAFSSEEDAPTQWRRVIATMQMLKEEVTGIRTMLDEQKNKG